MSQSHVCEHRLSVHVCTLVLELLVLLIMWTFVCVFVCLYFTTPNFYISQQIFTQGGLVLVSTKPCL